MKRQAIPNTILICYADDNMQTSQKLCVSSGMVKGEIFDAASWGPDQIESDSDFYNRNWETLEGKQRGGGKGFWLWKPYMCEYTLRNMPEGHYVIYADAGIEFISSIKPLIDLMEKQKQEIFLFGNGHTHMMWCKKKVLDAMIPNWYSMHDPHVWEQVQASVIIFKVSPYTRKFARCWLAWSEIPGFIDDSDNVGITQHYRDHRNDQSIVTNLAIQDNIALHWWPVQYGHCIRNRYSTTDDYQQIFYHHRWREEDWVNNKMTPAQFILQPKNI